MRTNLKITNSLNMISEMSGDSTFQILEFDDLKGTPSIKTAKDLFYMKESGMRLRQVRILLEDSSVRVQAGALSYLKGNIEMSNKMGGLLGLGKKLIGGNVTGESTFKPIYSGTGEMFLEPSFGHYALIELEDDEIVVDDGLFFACEAEVKVGTAAQKTISAAFLGNEGFFQTKLQGNGIAVLELPVPESEIFKCILINDTLKVDGNFAVLRTGDIEFSVEKSSKSIIGAATSGEGFVNVYRGTGEVWLMPTKDIYNRISGYDVSPLMGNQGSSNTKV
ncbi:AIM24 family protein [Clostridium polynesiense]|uniref:AIM24 family protein n=1 Tax=Clostridium polynesiense TaxID=1325933 RepID=UPI0005911EB9|nr:AIM24 family protein [Clostridium polynesiense]